MDYELMTVAEFEALLESEGPWTTLDGRPAPPAKVEVGQRHYIGSRRIKIVGPWPETA